MTKTLTIEIPDYQQGLYEQKVDALKNRGFNDAEAQVWAALYIREYPMRSEETAEKVIETFGTILLGSPANTTHLMSKLREADLLCRIEQMTERMNKQATI